MDAELAQWCQQVGYSPEWFANGLLNIDFVQMQAIEYQQYPDSDLTQYKRDAYRYLLAQINWRDRAQFQQFMQIAVSDPNEDLANAAVGQLIESGKVRYDWFMALPDADFLQRAAIQPRLRQIQPP